MVSARKHEQSERVAESASVAWEEGSDRCRKEKKERCRWRRRNFVGNGVARRRIIIVVVDWRK